MWFVVIQCRKHSVTALMLLVGQQDLYSACKKSIPGIVYSSLGSPPNLE